VTQVTTSSHPPVPSGGPYLAAPGVSAPPGVPAGSSVTPPGHGAPDLSRRRTALRSVFEGTPGRLRLAGITAVLSCLALSLLGFASFSTRASALSDARADAAQLIRVQQIATTLVAADSRFTNGYLAYGLESSANLAAYDSAIREASNLIAEASAAQPADAPTLAAVNDQLTQYTARVAAARANNVHGFQVATGYLRQANVLLRGDTAGKDRPSGMLPALERLMTVNSDRVDGAYDRSGFATWILVGTVLITFGGLITVQVRLARRTHRYLNVPLAVSSVIALLLLGAGSVVMMSAQVHASDVRDTSYRALQNVARARIAAYTAKSAESISLIYLGTGGAHQTAQAQFVQSTKETSQLLRDLREMPGSAELAAWQAKHKEVYSEASTQYENAIKKATRDSADASTLNGTFTALEKATGVYLQAQAGSVDSGLLAGRVPLLVLSWLSIIVGLCAAVLAWAGVSQRLEEYR
jgi:hypothetical protein